MILALAIACPWYIWVGVRTDGAWLRGFFIEHNVGRAMSAMEGHSGGWWFYPLASLVGLFPWSLMLIPIAMWVWKHTRRHTLSPALQLGLIWMVVYMVVFSLARTKLPSYITPSYPGGALLIGSFLSSWSRRTWTLSPRWLSMGALAHAALGTAIMAGIAYAANLEGMPQVLPHAAWGIGFLVVAIAMFWTALRGHQQPLPWMMLASAALFVGGIFGSATRSVDAYRNDLDAILTQQTFTDASGLAQRTRWMAIRSIEPSWVYYLQTPIVELPSLSVDGSSIDDESIELLAKHLEQPEGRAIVDSHHVEELMGALSQRYQLTVDRAVELRAFLKTQSMVVLRGANASNTRMESNRTVTRSNTPSETAFVPTMS